MQSAQAVEPSDAEKEEINRLIVALCGTLQVNRATNICGLSALMILTAQIAANALVEDDESIIDEFRKCLIDARIGTAEGVPQ